MKYFARDGAGRVEIELAGRIDSAKGASAHDLRPAAREKSCGKKAGKGKGR